MNFVFVFVLSLSHSTEDEVQRYYRSYRDYDVPLFSYAFIVIYRFLDLKLGNKIYMSKP